MNILMAHNFYQQSGGEDQSFLAEAGVLEAFGHHVTRYALHNDEVAQIGAARTAVRTVWSAPAARDVLRLVRANKVQVAHFQNTFPLISPAAYYAARRGGAVVVQALRNYRLTCSNALLFREGKVCERCLGKFMPLSGVRLRCYRDSLAGSAVVAAMIGTHKTLGTYRRQVDTYIAISEFVKHKYVEAGFDPEQIVVKPNVVAPDPGVGAGRGGFALFVGRLTEEKGVRTLLKAWQKPGLLPLRIVGDGPLEGEVEAAARGPGIEFLGRRTLAQTHELMGEASVVIVPSEWYEPFGRVVVEAYAKGTPVIAAASGGMTELIEPGRTGALFRPGDADDLADKVKWLLGQGSGLTELRRRARAAYLQSYTPERNHAQLMDIYENALSRGPRTRTSRLDAPEAEG